MYENLKIVVVEDDRGLNELMCRRLKREKHEPIPFFNASDAVDYMTNNEVNLLITDMSLPDFSGDKLISILHRNNIKVPFIVATGQGSETTAVKMIKKGARDYLVKNSGFLDLLPSTVEMVWHEVQLESLLEKAREKIHLQNATLSAISSFSPDGIIALDDQGKILSFNKTLYNICGLDEVYEFDDGMDFFTFLAEKIDSEPDFETTISSIDPEFNGSVFKEIELNEKYFELFSTPMIKDGTSAGSGRIWYFTDITRHKNAATAMEKAKKETEANAKMRSQFFAVVSHDVRTPLNSIMGFLGLLQESGLTETQKNYIHSIHTSGDHLLQLVNDILDFSRIEHGAIELHMQDMPVNGVLNECIYNLTPLAEANGVELKLSIDDDVPDIIKGDMLRIRQILINLIGNAVKFTKDGTVSLLASQSGDRLMIKVVDTGIGISEEVQKYLFSPFTQADASITQKYGGSGLGLAISKHLAELLDGSLTLESKLNAGSTFTLCLPIQIN